MLKIQNRQKIIISEFSLHLVLNKIHAKKKLRFAIFDSYFEFMSQRRPKVCRVLLKMLLFKIK